MKDFLENLMNNYSSKNGKIFSFLVQGLILLSIITFSIDTLPSLSKEFKKTLSVIELVTVVFFTVEYFLRIIISKDKLKFLFSFYGFIDLFAFLPFYISSGLDLRAIRIFRLLRLFRILKILRYNKAIHRFQRAFVIVKEELVLFGIVSLMVLYLSAVGIYFFENEAQPKVFSSVFHSLWWAVSTLTTVGYGDIYPITNGGKIFTFVVLTVGIGIVAIPAGLISSALTQTRREEASKD
jgi:voltage-gated potassium channel